MATSHEQPTRVINIIPTSSADGLRSKLEMEARCCGLSFRQFIGDIYTYATRNKKSFSSPFQNPRRRGGDHIGAVVTEQVAKDLTRWAKTKRTARGELCRYILEKILEDGLFNKIFDVTDHDA